MEKALSMVTSYFKGIGHLCNIQKKKKKEKIIWMFKFLPAVQ